MTKNMSFLPEDYLEKRLARRTIVICVSLFAIVVLGVVGAYAVTSRQGRDVRKLQAQVNHQFEEAARRLDQLQKLQKQKQEMIDKAKLASVLVARVPRSRILAELINHMPPQLSLLELDLKTKVLHDRPRPRTSLQRAKQKQSDRQARGRIDMPHTQVLLNLVGIAPTDVEVARFMTALSDHPLFDDVALQFSEQQHMDGRAMRKFRIQMVVNQEVDLTRIKPTLVRRLKRDPMGRTMRIDETGQFAAPQAMPTALPAAALPGAGGDERN